MSHDLVLAARSLRRDSAFAPAVVATLALGIGACVAAFAVVRSIVLRPLPLPDSERVVALCETSPRFRDFCVVSPPNLEDLAAATRTLEAVGLARDWPFALAAESGAIGVDAAVATPGFLGALGASAQRGRLLEPGDLEPGSHRVAVVSHAFWTERRGSAADAVGAQLVLDGQSYTVVGVLAPAWRAPGLEHAALWLPLTAIPDDITSRGWRGFQALGKLAPDTPLAQAREELATLWAGLVEAHPETNAGWTLGVERLRDRVNGPVRDSLWLYLGAVGAMLLIGCSNVCHLLLVRLSTRRHELLTRAALGAGRRELARPILAEIAVLVALGGAGGVALAYGLVGAFRRLAPPGTPRLEEVAIDGWTLAFAFGVAAGSALLVGLWPAARAVRLSATPRTATAGPRETRTRARLLVAQTALAFVLLATAGALLQAFTALLRWDGGFDRNAVAVLPLFSSPDRFATGDAVVAHHELLAREAAAVPGVAVVGLGSAGPLFGGIETGEVALPGEPAAGDAGTMRARWFDVDAGFFDALGLRLVAGRSFEAGDRAGAPAVAVVNEALARRLGGVAPAVGRLVAVDGREAQVVGVVRDLPPLLPGQPVEPQVYWPKRQVSRWASFLVVRAAPGADPGSLERALRERLEGVDPQLQLGRWLSLERAFGRELVRPRFMLAVLGVFATLGVLLAAVGTYGVVGHVVESRAREAGIRLALGAARRSIALRAFRGGAVPVALGLALGLVLAVSVPRGVRAAIPGGASADWTTLAAMAALFLGVAALACWLPARRAATVDPIAALRAE